jgi:hypothetical protein
MNHPMNLSRTRKLLAVLAVVGGLSAGAKIVRAHESPESHDPVAAIRAGQQMAQCATALWNAMTPEQQKQLGFEFKSDERMNWHFVPRERKGLPWKQMTHAQRELGHALMASGLGQKGFIEATTIMSLEQVLKDMEQGRGPLRDPENYAFSIFGNPAAKDSKEPWGWRVEGHHLSLNFTIAGDKGIAAGPVFFGSNPAEVRQGPRAGLRVLGAEEDMGRALVKSLTEEQKKKAILEGKVPGDILSFNKRKAEKLEPLGIASTDLNDAQKKQLGDLVKEYAHRLRNELAAQDIERIEKAGLDKVHFAWAGGFEVGQPHYYRVEGPTFLIEYDNTQNNANHVHSVWRDLENDWGEDLLQKHYQQDHNK